MEVVGTSCAMEVGDLDPVDWIVVMKNWKILVVLRFGFGAAALWTKSADGSAGPVAGGLGACLPAAGGICWVFCVLGFLGNKNSIWI
jgi:hypothetical protein